MSKVVVCGAAGGIGQPLSMLLKANLPPGSTLALYDVINVPGVAADISHINTQVKVESYLGDMKNSANVEERNKALKGANLVLIPAGVPRKPGMTRDDLFKINAGIVKGLIEGIATQCPDAFIAIITNPVNSTVPVAAEVLKKQGVYNPNKLFGVSILDVVRAQAFIGELKGKDSSKVQVDVIGGHSPETMIPVLSQVSEQFTEEEAKTLTQRVKEAGTFVVNAKDGAGSATLSMAYAAFRFASSIIKAINGEKVREVAFVDAQSLKVESIPTPYFGLAVDIEKSGITKVYPIPKLNDYEETQMKEAVVALKANIETGVTFAKL